MLIDFVLGTSIASFVMCAAFRLNNKKSLLGFSKCDWCQERISIISLIPILGFLFNFGKCSKCKLQVPIKYFFSELFTGLFFVFISSAELKILIVVLLFLSEEDFFDQTSNSWIVFFLTPLFLNKQENNFIFLFLLIVALYFSTIIFEVLGVGDMPVLLILFLALGQISFLVTILLASIFALIFQLIKKESKIPFIPFLMYGLFSSQIVFLL